MYFIITGIIAIGYGALSAFGWIIASGGEDTLVLLLCLLLISTGIGSYKYGKSLS